MCLSIPAKIVSINGVMAEVSAGGAVFNAGLHMIENAREGDYILLHAGFAIQKISEEEAFETIKLFEEMNNYLKE
jgi:hydrogenase expression/formation protein HypC